ncbi:MAG: CRISPR-associated helicase Cas3' [Verrucomicrobiae bacterium]|nr:CRISPR-associated helicase Cas3' [Verrucomicrobiae bacterium]MCP5541360.1 CRISPR-associated helicase Cas3' [Akkermansiaceae bacterium]
MKQAIAHVRKSDSATQTLEVHLEETADLCSSFSETVGLPQCGRLLGLLHDLGKYSYEFQKYIRGITGINGEKAKAEAEKRQGKIDHATSGAQLIWEAQASKRISPALAQILSVVIMSHHSRSGMKDFVDLTGKSPFLNRVGRSDAKTHKSEALAKAAPEILNEVNRLLDGPSLQSEFENAIGGINNVTTDIIPRQNAFALLTRFLFSCLLDADRLSTADFESPKGARFRSNQTPNWSSILSKFEDHLRGFKQEKEIDSIRRRISDECRDSAGRQDNLFTLQVPTGGGKTLASLRFALHRAASSDTHQVNRIIYVLPYTSILDQNAEEVRKILGDDVVLEHHSNLAEERDTWRNRVLSENWDAPVVFTTSVQFLNALFAAGTKTARRMHQLCNAILIFDEIQSLPIKTIHLFNNAIEFLCTQTRTTVVLCTATLPLLHKVDPTLGALRIKPFNGLVRDKVSLFKSLKRTEIVDGCRPGGWSFEEVAKHALELQSHHQSLLVICNTKASARSVFELLKKRPSAPVVHLSTNMCPAHRRHKIAEIRRRLNPDRPEPVICVSTQLIEAGVDLDFGCVIRSLAGLDSIVQAAGRCNRHGMRKTGYVHVLNFSEEKLFASLKEFEEAQQITKDRLFQEFSANPDAFDGDLLSEKAMDRFYEYWFYRRASEMSYPCKAGKGEPPLAQSCSLLSLLSTNAESVSEAERTKNTECLAGLKFKHAHSTAAQAFRVIDAPTQGIVVPYDKNGHEGSRIIGDLTACYTNDRISLAEQVRRHKKAQHYTVNAFPHVIDKLRKTNGVHEIQGEAGIYHLDERHYDDDLGITLEALSEQHFLHVQP